MVVRQAQAQEHTQARDTMSRVRVCLSRFRYIVTSTIDIYLHIGLGTCVRGGWYGTQTFVTLDTDHKTATRIQHTM